MSTNAQYYVHSCLGPDIPEVVLRSVQDDHKVKYIFELNEDLETQLQNKAVSERMDITLTVGGEEGLAEYQAPVVMRLPRGYDPAKKYPVLSLQIVFSQIWFLQKILLLFYLVITVRLWRSRFSKRRL